MTVINMVPIRRLPYRGSDDPALPTGIWWGTGVIVGDASAGTMQVRFTLKAEGDPVSGDVWNVEQLMAFVSDNSTTHFGFITAVGLSPSREAPGVDALYPVSFPTLGAGSGQAAIGFQPVFPKFLGGTRGGSDTLAAIGIGLTNLTASDSLSVSMMGYIWEARSLMVEGGPQRPERPLFGFG